MDRSTGTERLQLLHKIDSGLDSNDVAALKFLCKDLVPQKHLERVHDGRDLFLRLEDQGLLEDDLLVGDLLYTIQRRDLLRLLGRDAMEQSLQDPRNSRISPYRKMLYNLSEDVTEDNLRTIKFLLKLPRGKLEPNASFLDVLVAMEKQELLREDSLEALEKVCTHCDKRLATKVREFAEHRAREETPGWGHNLRVSRRESSVRSYTDSNPSPEDGSQLVNSPPRSLQVTPNASVPEPSLSRTPVHHQLSVDAGTESIYEEAYDMSRRPRGHCIIINNHNFEASRKHPNRDGTDVDARALKEVFERMHFRVHPHRDLTQARLLSVLEEFGSMTHGELDAFVCCVLSHGKKGFVYGTDGEPVSIRQLTQLFTSSRCPSLAGKPKLFFIQACQVQEPCIQSDGPGDTLYETDAVRPDTIPDDSDFLLGMATVEYQKAYRHNQNGSAFIQELCKQLKCGSPRKEDILAIMTKVNREVSRISFGKFKQMPEPRYTLTKKVILTMD
ncbi:caspase-8-like isoform X2 [Conger conger]|uniref:caspase-8-like isoform X2 n=1 Tax=Conger conger TaxID=82655 RepID=UPI002A5A5E8A|nr:caspase-8-like isoform X2 [Conger conger]